MSDGEATECLFSLLGESDSSNTVSTGGGRAFGDMGCCEDISSSWCSSTSIMPMINGCRSTATHVVSAEGDSRPGPRVEDEGLGDVARGNLTVGKCADQGGK